MKRLILLVAVLAGFGAGPLAFAAELCQEGVQRIDNIQIQVIGSSAPGDCFVNITPRDNLDLVYRSYLFAASGLWLAFNSYGDGPESSDTGAREYYLFPRKGLPSYSVLPGGEVQITLSTGDPLTVDTATGRLLSLGGGKFTEASVVDRANRGGLEIDEYRGLVLDVGYRQGSSPSQRSAGRSEFRDALGNRCTLINKELFRYPESNEEEVTFRYATDRELADFLRKRCPDLRVEPLLDAVPARA
ncbi:MAG: hypothetical protein NDJ90_05325 [Oligoflexia bacterium]|nr:hypothetical protein [Oligoflexia bacterium]